MSHLVIVCPRCNQELEVARESLGRWVSCPHCQMQFAALAQTPASSRYFAPSELTSRRRPPWILFGWIFTGLTALGALVLLMIVINHVDIDEPAKGQAKKSPAVVQARSPDFQPKHAVERSREPDDQRAKSTPAPSPASTERTTIPRTPTESLDPIRLPDPLPPLPSEPTMPSSPGARIDDRPQTKEDTAPPSEPVAREPATSQPAPAVSSNKSSSSARPLAPRSMDVAVIRTLNLYRKAALLPPVYFDPESSVGCLAHARYLIRNREYPSIQGFDAYRESPGMPAYTEKGAAAAASSLIQQGSWVAALPKSQQLPQALARRSVPIVNSPVVHSPAEAVDVWMGNLYYRVPLLRPDVNKIGIGYAADQKHFALVVDAGGGLGTGFKQIANREAGNPIIFPTANQKNVPRVCSAGLPGVPVAVPGEGDEGNNRKNGYPITVTFSEETSIEDVEVTVAGPDGVTIPAWVSTPSQPANTSVAQPGTICVITQLPFQARATYAFTVSAKINKAPWSRSWRFSTGLK
jgi:uncharacterized protein YkwD